MNPLHLIWIVPLCLFLGGEVTSIVEYVKKYNLADLEKDELATLKAEAEEKLAQFWAKIRARL